MILKHFKISEFDSPDLPNSGVNMDTNFLIKLDLARQLAGTPFFINSGYRTKEHNLSVGGTSLSSHLKGLAADIRCSSSQERYKILYGLVKAGFKRIGIHRNFIHVDLDSEKPQNIIFLYS